MYGDSKYVLAICDADIPLKTGDVIQAGNEELEILAIITLVTVLIVGLLISKLLYDSLITSHYSYAVWSVPVGSLMFIILFVAVAAILAVYAPAKRIRNTSVTETINEL